MRLQQQKGAQVQHFQQELQREQEEEIQRLRQQKEGTLCGSHMASKDDFLSEGETDALLTAVATEHNKVRAGMSSQLAALPTQAPSQLAEVTRPCLSPVVTRYCLAATSGSHFVELELAGMHDHA
ncbi:UNVERIFIED_CONTAM: hypothetical protein K2H54_001832 [Gekko kuhli]